MVLMLTVLRVDRCQHEDARNYHGKVSERQEVSITEIWRNEEGGINTTHRWGFPPPCQHHTIPFPIDTPPDTPSLPS